MPAGFWNTIDVAGTTGEVIALGDDLSPGTLLDAYRHGCFPWPGSGWPAIPWCSPDPRAVLPPGRLHVSRSLRARLRTCGWHTTVDTAFDDVVAGCADRPETWITPAMRTSYGALHREGHAHSIEVWTADGRLAGGLYGVHTGGIFSGESMFHAQSDAAKIALVDLVARLRTGGGVLLDCQQPTEHLRRMGQVVVRRADYLALLLDVRDRPVRLPRERLPVARLVQP